LDELDDDPLPGIVPALRRVIEALPNVLPRVRLDAGRDSWVLDASKEPKLNPHRLVGPGGLYVLKPLVRPEAVESYVKGEWPMPGRVALPYQETYCNATQM
jgi:hypothetical protein